MSKEIVSGQVCTDNFHMYPKTYAGDPQYAEEYFNTCLCGKKRKIVTVREVDNKTEPPIITPSGEREI